MKMKCFLCLLLIFITFRYVEAATYYVATTGSNSASCGPSGDPCQTITYAYGKAGAGDTVLVTSGTYHETTAQSGLAMNKNGTSGNPITVRSEVKWGAILDGQFSATTEMTVRISGDWNVLDGFDIKNAYENNIFVSGDNNLITNNLIHNAGTNSPADPDFTLAFESSGLKLNPSADNNTISKNYIYDNGRPECGPGTGNGYCNLDHGIYYTASSNVLFVNNVVYGNSGYGFHLVSTSLDVSGFLRLYNNVSHDNGRSGILVGVGVAVGSEVEIKNNISSGNGSSPLGPDYGVRITSTCDSGTVTLDSNISYNNVDGAFQNQGTCTVTNTNLITTDPLFVSSTDFHLQSSSPARDAGLTLTQANPDIDDVSRPQGSAYDIGPYEFVTSVVPTHTVLKSNFTMIVDGSLTEFENANQLLILGGNGNASDIRMLWTDTHLYLGMITTDTELISVVSANDTGGIHLDDSLEFLIDSANDGGWNANDYKITINLLGFKYDVSGDATATTWDGPYSSDVAFVGTLGDGANDTSYSIELGIPWSSIGVTPQTSTPYGMNFHINDGDTSGRTFYVWNGSVNTVVDAGDVTLSNTLADPPTTPFFSAAPTNVGTTAAANPSFAGAPTSVGTTAAANPSFAGTPSNVSDTAANNPTFADPPSSVGVAP